eukprot:4427649-Prymnesium_polylepis.3
MTTWSQRMAVREDRHGNLSAMSRVYAWPALLGTSASELQNGSHGTVCGSSGQRAHLNSHDGRGRVATRRKDSIQP